MVNVILQRRIICGQMISQNYATCNHVSNVATKWQMFSQVAIGSKSLSITLYCSDCHPLENPINGTVDTSAGSTYGKEAIYSCDTGYTLVGNFHVNCQANGSWETAPTCQIVSKCYERAIINFIICFS